MVQENKRNLTKPFLLAHYRWVAQL